MFITDPTIRAGDARELTAFDGISFNEIAKLTGAGRRNTAALFIQVDGISKVDGIWGACTRALTEHRWRRALFRITEIGMHDMMAPL